MTKTLTINLAGHIFHINEDAYETMLNYFNSLKKFYANDDSKDEIIKDIEARFCELFLAKKKDIIAMDDAQSVINLMGNPEQFEADETTESQQNNTQNNNSNWETYASNLKDKSLYRNTDNAIVSGVCSGLSAYLGITDPIWIRLIAILAVIFGLGSPVLIYIILWIVMPEAKNSSEKLRMSGEKINLESIQSKVKNELNSANNNISNNLNNSGFLNQMVHAIGKIFAGFITVLWSITKVFLVILAVILFLSLAATVVGLIIAFFAIIPLASKYFFDTNMEGFVAGLGGILTIGIPFLLGTFALIHLFSSYKVLKKIVVLPLIGLFILGIILSGFSINKAKKLVAEKRIITQEVPINYASNLDTIELFINQTDKKETNININGIHSFLDFLGNNHNMYVPIEVEVYQSKDEQVHIVKEFSSRGKTEQDAFKNATSIKHNLSQINNQFYFDNYIEANTKDVKYRNQRLVLKVFVPNNKVIKWNEEVEDFMDENDLPIDWNSTKEEKNQVDINKTDSTNQININVNGKNINIKTNIDDEDEDTEDETIDMSYEHYIFRMKNGLLQPLD